MIFSPDDVQTRLRQQPFVPVRIVTTTGQTYDVYHPDLVLVARRFLVIGTPSSENPTQAEQVTRVALVHVAELRDLPPTQPLDDGAAA
ncbi:MAG: hypothetical protein NZM31_11335 [Gemmatales bacterium]|nr:hypothetical protein [Gemmatales bacterium]MDW8387590.1 hypothetical protein [Gemmatales bacterium]